MIHRLLALVPAVLLVLPTLSDAMETENANTALPTPTVAQLPRWRGFNLLNKFQQKGQRPFEERDFRIIHEWGFNAVRLPMDYRCWIKDGDWRHIDENIFKDLDQVVAWGKQYGIHVMMNFHRAPGYTVAKPAETLSLWKDAEALDVCTLHWRTFARHYQGVPSSQLSFDLMNEPANVDSTTYARVVKVLVAAIHAEDAQRLVIADGLDWGNQPCAELVGCVAQATRGYQPMGISHFRASWIGGSGSMPQPLWPCAKGDGLMAGPGKQQLHGPLVLNGPFPAAARLRLKVGTVSDKAHLVVKADDTLIWEHDFINGPGTGEWKQVVEKPEWHIYQNIYDRDYTCVIPAGTRQVAILTTSGDWLQLTELGLQDDTAANHRETIATLVSNWKNKPAALHILRKDADWSISGTDLDRAWLRDTCMKPWLELQPKGLGVVVGEWGAFNKTPHEVVMHWMEDSLANWKEAKWGWMLWEFRGSFGVLDSQRSDVTYEDFQGMKLDREMLTLLQKY